MRVIDPPRTAEQTGIPRRVLEELTLKTAYLLGEASLHDLAEHLRIDLPIVDDLFQQLRKEQLCQVTGMSAGVHRIVLTSEGKTRALDALAITQYVGAVPVALPDYIARVRAQTVRDIDVSPEAVEHAFADLVLDPQVLRQIGSALMSGRAIFFYGPAGTGKTTVAETLLRLFEQQHVWIPHAVEDDGQIIALYDPLIHQAVDDPVTRDSDQRWVLCRRPRVVVGGELTIEMLDLQFNPVTKYYAAPAQLKATNGLLIVDDFGRQRVRPEELLNRWVVPLDRGIDFLTLAGGKKIEIPFDVLVAFATNLDPKDLVDEAFLRRIQTKIRLGNVTPEQFQEIFRRVCIDSRLSYDSTLVEELINTITTDLGHELRACYARDIVNQVCWLARYEQRPPKFDRDSLTHAVRAYFVSPD
jgi:predicted ATPase with chaperone activity